MQEITVVSDSLKSIGWALSCYVYVI